MILKIGKIKYQISRGGVFPIIDDYTSNPKPERQSDDFLGKVMLVVGASSGIGLSIVKEYLRCGAYVVAASRSNGGLDDIVSNKLEILQWDISRIDDINAKLNSIVDKYGKIDCVVLAAGVNSLPSHLTPSTILEREKAEVKFIHGINVIGICEICKTLKRLFLNAPKTQKLKIINIISNGALLEEPSPYFTSKHAIYSFTKAFAEECREGNILVYGICPGEVRTKMIYRKNFTILSWMAKDKRKAHPDEIAKLTRLMSSDGGDLLAGNMVVFDGGESVRSKF